MSVADTYRTVHRTLCAQDVHLPPAPPTLTLLPELRLAFLDSSHHHVTYTSSWQPVQAALNSLHRNDVQVLGTYEKKNPPELANS